MSEKRKFWTVIYKRGPTYDNYNTPKQTLKSVAHIDMIHNLMRNFESNIFVGHVC